jgi:hypothetical protein
MPIRTLNVEKLQDTTGNIYESIVILSKRSRQIAAREKLELDEKLKYFEGFEDEEEFAFNEEQERISKEFERRPHATQRAVDEMLNEKVSYRKPEQP